MLGQIDISDERPLWAENFGGIQIPALSETRFADVGEIKEVGAGYTVFWSGRKSEERREARVGIAITTELVGKLPGLPKGTNDRLMTLRLPLSGNNM